MFTFIFYIDYTSGHVEDSVEIGVVRPLKLLYENPDKK